MRAIRVHHFGDPAELRVETIDPPVPGPGEALVRVHAAGVNPVDTYIRSGTYARLPPLPYTPGFDGAGRIEAVGPGVDDLAAGDRVYIAGLGAAIRPGTYAELVACPRDTLHRLPDRLSFAQGAGVGVPYVTAAHALFGRAQLRPLDTVLIHGASGGVGLACVQFARAFGATVIGTAGSPEGRDLVRQHGAHHVVDHRADGYAREIATLAPRGGVDVIVEMLANVNLARDLELLAPGGRLVVVGSRGSIEINPRLIMAKEARVTGTMLWNVPKDEQARLLALVNAGLEAGTLTPVVGREIPLESAAEAHRAVLEPGARGKIVLVP
jgi:NADPH2:quinone reductase